MTFPFPTFLGRSSAAMVYSYEGSAVDDTNASSYTFIAKNIGAAGSGRIVLVGIGTSGGTPRTVTGVTADGVTMTKGPESVGVSLNRGSATWLYLQINTGTTATFEVTLDGTALNCTIVVYRLFPVSGTPIDTVTVGAGGSPPQTLTDLEVRTSGLALILSASTADVTSYSWGGGDTPIRDETNLTNDAGHPTNAWSITSTGNDTTADFTVSNGTAVQLVGISFQ